MKAITTLTVDTEVLARARKDIENLSGEFENFLRAELELGQGKNLKDKLGLARVKVANVTKELIKVTEEREGLKRDNKALKIQIGKLEKKMENTLAKKGRGFIPGDFYTKQTMLGKEKGHAL